MPQRKEKKFNKYGNLIRPAMYIIISAALTLLDFKVLGAYSLIPLLLIVIGYPVGRFLTKNVVLRQGEKGGLYYRRSRITFALYIITIIIRILYFQGAFPISFTSELIINSMLGFVAGILVGEAHIMSNKAGSA